MDLFDKLYDEDETVKVRFVGFTTEHVRYDFGIVYTNMFFGKPLVVCMQTGRSTLMDAADLRNTDNIQKAFNIKTKKEAEELLSFFEESLPYSPIAEQYD
ncbi:DUF3055 domain-containing protein [Pseudalkalibacillus salsuginis]|uniref:DUF3055 domain-containing protein n=1 Tax=Pseudalkalibacillus salsuginis TaxID=2910972 RepID=UPI001F29C0D4|nr:DUF3055 domain-containing protein [Pseudalkalibacillus salsuginis]MCF6412047.1 DUF3055 domain-containing protein [Pseudalkalibacillus salsuginis]